LHGVDDYRALRQVESFFKKNLHFSDDTICQTAAKESFIASEQLCADTNHRLETFYLEHGQYDPDLKLKLEVMERYIKRALGSFSRFFDKVPSLMRVTAGATSTRSRRNSLPFQKMTLRPVCTYKAWPYVKALYKLYGFNNVRPRFTMANRVELVPKNWKTHRTIACEPESNMYFQLAFDRWVKNRLRFLGQDLSDQFRNKQLAKEGSMTGALATVDFSNASDTISFNTVSLLFPREWFEFLRDHRSPCYTGVFGCGRYEKFSSMGNGSTFCIETLIFAAAAYACGSKRFSVYGDDVIIESELIDEFIALTQFLGLNVNETKTFSQGPVRESCGSEWFNGVDVLPTYIRSINNKAELCHVINCLSEVALPYGKLWKYLSEIVISERLPLTPFSDNTLSGIHLPATYCYERKLFRYHRGTQTVQFRGYTHRMGTRRVADYRALFLWYLQYSRGIEVVNPLPWNFQDGFLKTKRIRDRVSSLVPTFSHGYVRKWDRWIVPSAGASVQAYAWAEFLLSAVDLAAEEGSTG
jgi:hypothetical protein